MEAIVDFKDEMAGLPGDLAHPVDDPPASADRPLNQAWITDELLAETRDVFSRAYGELMNDSDAVDILVNIKRLAEALVEIRRERKRDERRGVGAGLVPRTA